MRQGANQSPGKSHNNDKFNIASQLKTWGKCNILKLIFRLSWIKDGRKLAEDEDGIIVTTEGHLIIVSARLTDSGNFTCVAENLAGSRRSPPAEIVIYGECLKNCYE